MRMWTWAIVVAAAASVAGCITVGPDYERPAIDVPTAWRIELVKAEDVANTKWWEQFRDPVLNDLIATALREIREYGWRERYVSARVGINSRLDPMQAAILGVKLGSLATANARRQAVAARYDAVLSGLPLVLPSRRAQSTHVFHQYVVRLAEREFDMPAQQRLQGRRSVLRADHPTAALI